jgi:hypothetical protein
VTDWGPGFWPLDEASGSTFVDTISGRNATLHLPTVWTGSTFVPAPPGVVEYRVIAPATSGVGLGLREYASGFPYYSNPVTSPNLTIPVTAGQWGNMYQRQAFTVAMKLQWHGPALGVGAGGSPGGVGQMYSGPGNVRMGLAPQRGPDDPYFLWFTRGGAATLYGAVDMPAGLNYTVWDDYGGGTYREPIKVPTWCIVVFRYDGARKDIWVDAVQVGADTSDDTVNIGFSSAAITINNVLNMDYAELAIWHRALTDLEITGP